MALQIQIQTLNVVKHNNNVQVQQHVITLIEILVRQLLILEHVELVEVVSLLQMGLLTPIPILSVQPNKLHVQVRPLVTLLIEMFVRILLIHVLVELVVPVLSPQMAQLTQILIRSVQLLLLVQQILVVPNVTETIVRVEQVYAERVSPDIQQVMALRIRNLTRSAMIMMNVL